MAKRHRQVVMAFDKRLDKSDAGLRGGKGSHLVRMQALGLPVPPGFTIITTVARAVSEHGTMPKRLLGQLERELVSLERKTGKRLGDPQNPLLLSIRSGAPVSMPGMMDTILNLGMSREIRDSLAGSVSSSFAHSCYDRLVSQMGDKFTDSPREQLMVAIEMIVNSWHSERALAYRASQNIPHSLGTAVTVQAMVFGNMDQGSGTGVAFSRDPNTGKPGLYGEFLPCAQGEDLVSGVRTPVPIASLVEWNHECYKQLAEYASLLERDLDGIADIEFTIESGVLYMLQCRKAKPTAVAAATFAVHQQWAKRWSKEQALKSVAPEQLDALTVSTIFHPEAVTEAHILGRGIPASPGAVVGHIATSSEEAIEMKKTYGKVILVRPDTDPNDLPGMLAADGIVTFTGGATCHAAVVARELGKPAVVGIGDGAQLLSEKFLSVCGTTGNVYQHELLMINREATKEVTIFRKWHTAILPAPQICFQAVAQVQDVRSLLCDVYLLNGMAQAARGSSLAHRANMLKQQVTVSVAESFACYLAIAVASEIRHVYETDIMWSESSRSDIEKLQSLFGISKSFGRGDDKILQVLRKLTPEDRVEFFALTERLFNGKGWRSGYGGPKWAAIAHAGRAFLSGKWTHGVFVDHVFDLRHNGGRLFDKHPMLTGEDHRLPELLEYKKRLQLGELFVVIKRMSNFNLQERRHFEPRFTPSPESLALWEKGCVLKLWKENPRD